MKKTIRLLFLTVMVMIGFVAGAAVNFEVGNYKYYAADDSYECFCMGFTDAAASSVDIVSIPSVVTYNGRLYRVTMIYHQAFQNRTKITRVNINWGTQIIGNSAFAGCSNLSTVYMPSSLTNVYSQAFNNCPKLKTVYYAGLDPFTLSSDGFPYNADMYLYVPPCTNTTIANYKTLTGFNRFQDIKTDIEANDVQVSAASGGDGTYCMSLGKDNIMGDKWTSTYREATIIGVRSNCTTFKPYNYFTLTGSTYQLSVKVVAIGKYACQNMKNITSVDLSGNSALTKVGEFAFSGCTALTTATVRGDKIERYAFGNCTALTSFTLQEGVKELGVAILNKTGVKQLILPSTVTNFGYAADGASQISSLSAVEGNQYYKGYYGLLYSKDGKCLVRMPEGRSLVSFTNEVTAIAPYAFQDCSKVTELELPYGITEIGYRAFVWCTGLKRLVIPGSVSLSETNEIIKGCSGLTDLSINLKTPFTLSSTAAWGTPANIDLHTPYGTESAYENAGWTGFKSYNQNNIFSYDFSQTLANFGTAYYSVEQTTGAVYTDSNGNENSYDGTVKLQSGPATNITANITIPTTIAYRNKTYGVTTLGEYSLPNAGYQFAISGGWLVSTIAMNAARGNFNITYVNLPHIKTIGDMAFYASSSNKLNSFNFPGTLESIGSRAFMYAQIKGNVILPYGIKSIGSDAFYNCNSITRMVVPSSVTTLGTSFASYCYGMEELCINIPASKLPSGFSLAASGTNQVTRVPVGEVEQWKKIITGGKPVEAGAFDFIYGYTYNTRYHMSVMNPINGDFTDPESGEKTHYDGWATYVYHPNIKTADGFTFDYIETDRITGKKFLMVALGDSVFAGTSLMEEIDGPTSTLLVIGHHAFEGCAVKHDLTFDIPLSIGELAFANMPNCPSVTILTPLDLSSSFNDSYIFDGNSDDFKFYIDNKYFKKAYDNCMDWDMADGYYAAQLRPFIRAEAKVMPVSCYLEWVNYPENGLHAYSVNGYNESKKTLELLEHDENFLNNQEHGVILTDLEPDKIYKLEPSSTDPATTTCSGDIDNYLTENWEAWTLKSDDPQSRWGWDAANQKFVRPATSMTIPGGSALLYIGDSDSALNIDEWTLTISNPLDVNNDGSVNVGDVNAVLAEILAHPDGDGDSKYDVSGDGSVNVGDVNVILAYILEHPDE